VASNSFLETGGGPSLLLLLSLFSNLGDWLFGKVSTCDGAPMIKEGCCVCLREEEWLEGSVFRQVERRQLQR
jgi:hypothetical protein